MAYVINYGNTKIAQVDFTPKSVLKSNGTGWDTVWQSAAGVWTEGGATDQGTTIYSSGSKTGYLTKPVFNSSNGTWTTSGSQSTRQYSTMWNNHETVYMSPNNTNHTLDYYQVTDYKPGGTTYSYYWTQVGSRQSGSSWPSDAYSSLPEASSSYYGSTIKVQDGSESGGEIETYWKTFYYDPDDEETYMSGMSGISSLSVSDPYVTYGSSWVLVTHGTTIRSFYARNSAGKNIYYFSGGQREDWDVYKVSSSGTIYYWKSYRCDRDSTTTDPKYTVSQYRYTATYSEPQPVNKITFPCKDLYTANNFRITDGLPSSYTHYATLQTSGTIPNANITCEVLTLSKLEVGESVFTNVNGVKTEFLVVHQGLPSSDYDASCDGTWLLMKDIYSKVGWGNSYNVYDSSSIHRPLLNTTFLKILDSNIQNTISSIKLPFWNGTGSGGSYIKGSKGLSTKVFLLSGYEVGFTKSDSSGFPGIGAKLSYFDSGTDTTANNKRKATYNGTATNWWLRSPRFSYQDYACCVKSDGNYSFQSCGPASQGIRPAFIMPSSTQVSSDGTIIV